MLVMIVINLDEEHEYIFNNVFVAGYPNVGDIMEIGAGVLIEHVMNKQITEEDDDYLYRKPFLVDRVVKTVLQEEAPSVNYGTIYLKPE